MSSAPDFGSFPHPVLLLPAIDIEGEAWLPDMGAGDLFRTVDEITLNHRTQLTTDRARAVATESP